MAGENPPERSAATGCCRELPGKILTGVQSGARIPAGRALNEELFTEYMRKPELQELVSKWLGSQGYGRLSTGKIPVSLS